MFRTKLNILASIVLISSTAALGSQEASAEPVCSTGTLASGAAKTQTFTLDASMRSHFTLETDQQDVALEIVDDARNVACATALPNPGFQTCGWMPVEGAVYTARILRPLPTTAANVADAPIPAADDETASHNIGQGSAADASESSASADDGQSGNNATPVVVVAAPTATVDANYTLCSDQSE